MDINKPAHQANIVQKYGKYFLAKAKNELNYGRKGSHRCNLVNIQLVYDYINANL